MEHASCNFQAERRSILLVTEKYGGTMRPTPILDDDCGVLFLKIQFGHVRTEMLCDVA